MFLVNDKDSIITNLGKMTIPSFISFVPNYCYQNQIDTIRLRGQKDYVEGLIAEPLTQAATEYGMNIKIEVEGV